MHLFNISYASLLIHICIDEWDRSSNLWCNEEASLLWSEVLPVGWTPESVEADRPFKQWQWRQRDHADAAGAIHTGITSGHLKRNSLLTLENNSLLLKKDSKWLRAELFKALYSDQPFQLLRHSWIPSGNMLTILTGLSSCERTSGQHACNGIIWYSNNWIMIWQCYRWCKARRRLHGRSQNILINLFQVVWSGSIFNGNFWPQSTCWSLGKGTCSTWSLCQPSAFSPT